MGCRLKLIAKLQGLRLPWHESYFQKQKQEDLGSVAGRSCTLRDAYEWEQRHMR